MYNKFTFKNILILGLGVSSRGVISLLTEGTFKHLDISFTLVDDSAQSLKEFAKNNPTLAFKLLSNTNVMPLLGRYDALIKSPGVSNAHPIVQHFLKSDQKVLTDIELLSYYADAPILAVTGSNGKTTTASIIDRILKEHKIKTYLCGNIGIPALSYKEKSDAIVLEASSFQLEHIDYFKPKSALITNIFSTHLERYSSVTQYAKTKFNVFKNMEHDSLKLIGDVTPNIEDSLRPLVKKYHVNRFQDGDGLIDFANQFDFSDWNLIGKHNLQNLYSAYLICRDFNLKNQLIQNAINNFSPISHRLETIVKNDHLVVINDSKSTNFTSTQIAVNAARESYPKFVDDIHLFLGGMPRDKSSYFSSEMIKMLNDSVKSLYLFGESRHQFEKELTSFDISFDIFSKERIREYAEVLNGKKGIILFSPGLPSFDQYKNFEERGIDFKRMFAS